MGRGLLSKALISTATSSITTGHVTHERLTMDKLEIIKYDRKSDCIFNFPDNPLKKTPLYHGHPSTPVPLC